MGILTTFDEIFDVCHYGGRWEEGREMVEGGSSWAAFSVVTSSFVTSILGTSEHMIARWRR